MNEIDLKGLIIRILIPAIAVSSSYLLIGSVCDIIPHILLFCILGTIVLVPIELGMIVSVSKKEYGTYSLKSAFRGQEHMQLWKIVLIALIFFGVAGLMSAFVAPIENAFWAETRTALLCHLPQGFDWTDYEYLKIFSRPLLVITCIYYGIFNVFIGPITEELFFRGYLTSHYKKQGWFVPILVSVLFSLYHFWLPFNNVFRILTFLPVFYMVYQKKNIYISMCFHCICNLFSVVTFAMEVLG